MPRRIEFWIGAGPLSPASTAFSTKKIGRQSDGGWNVYIREDCRGHLPAIPAPCIIRACRFQNILMTSPLSQPISQRLVDAEFGDMVKFVVDLDQEVICVGGEFHSDEEAILLDKGSKQAEPSGEPTIILARPGWKKLIYTSMINVRPRDG